MRQPPQSRSHPRPRHPASARLVVAGAAGVLAAAVVVVLGAGSAAPSAGWVVASLVYLGSTWRAIGGLDARQTASHAVRDDPSRTASDAVVLVASIASLAGVVSLLEQTTTTHVGRQDLAAALGLCSVAASWFVVHTVFTLRYARLYYTGRPGGISFNQEQPPRYSDFAYLAFTLGMTYQVSDTDLSSTAIRTAVLQHSLLSYLLGAVVLAATINLVVGLGTS